MQLTKGQTVTSITITGTGIPVIDPNRAGAGVLIRSGDVTLQFDAGRNTARRLMQAGVRVNDLDAIFLTHYHSDHVVGLPDMVMMRWVQDFTRSDPALDIVAPNGPTVDFCERMFDVWEADLDVRSDHAPRPLITDVNIVGFDVADELVEVWSSGAVRVLAGQVRHEPVVGAVGYRIECPDGVIAITGDTVVCDEVAALAEGADVVIYEAMRFAAVDHAMPPTMHYIKEYHANTIEIGAQMERLGIPRVMLTHLIPPPGSPEDMDGFADDVRSGGYTGEIIVCDDLTSTDLSAGAQATT